MKRVALYLVGGFLGAGKTTTLRVLAQRFLASGKQVAIVTNDQAENLVDTQALQHEGLVVEEVPGACFCCSFPELIDRLQRLSREARPEVILGEPVGSCTDLSATVLQPLKRFYPDHYWVRPLVVLVDPRRAQKILTLTPRGGFSPRAAYIYRKQLEEADVVGINKCDLLSQEEIAQLEALLQERFPQAPVVRLAARRGEGIDELIQVLERLGPAGRQIAEVDYDLYAEGEAELGWVNATAWVRSSIAFEPARLLWDLAERFRNALGAHGFEIAHVKLLALAGGQAAVVNCVSTEAPAEVSVQGAGSAEECEVVLNARVFAPPETLRLLWRRLCDQLHQEGYRLEHRNEKSLRPGRPVPMYRFSHVVEG